MSNTSQKHRNFVSEPMGDKPVTALPGIGPMLGRELQREGINKASGVLGHYLVQDRDPQRFGQWLKHSSGANSHQTSTCTRALKDWTDNNL
ncbi:barrier-to-autointegration factor-like protein [Archocentrus centrarchus]|uniref:barrier-to-autointegration factor-like protein n=1 Tax=Archocentrus centrarchus TaxID=63155 RepID=UPI0011EA14BC|nr:barrier-to-autointegration factor-like protein [Archocentrus centrarchus]